MMLRIYFVGCIEQPYTDIGSNLTLGELRKLVEQQAQRYHFEGLKFEVIK